MENLDNFQNNPDDDNIVNPSACQPQADHDRPSSPTPEQQALSDQTSNPTDDSDLCEPFPSFLSHIAPSFWDAPAFNN